MSCEAPSAPRTTFAGGRERMIRSCLQAFRDRPGTPGPPSGHPCQFPATPAKAQTPLSCPSGTPVKKGGYYSACIVPRGAV